jgi:electron transfer flavoprotein beta subunit
LFALEEALRLKDKFRGTVTALTMGPPQAEDALRKAISFGADHAILVTDRAFAGADTLATSFAIASAIRQIEKKEPVDIIFTGKQTIDGDTAQVGPGVAKRLNRQLLTYVSRIDSVDMEAREIVVQRRAEGGVQVIKTQLPCLITMLEGSNEIRYASMDNMFRAARYQLQVWNKDAAGIEDIGKIGLKGSPTVVSKVFAPQPRTIKAEHIDVERKTPQEIATTLISKLFRDRPKLQTEIAKRAMR